MLTATDLVHLGGTGVVSVAYPFSSGPRGHRVHLAGCCATSLSVIDG